MRNISGFQAVSRKLLAQDQGLVVYSTLEMYLNADTIFCGSNWIILYFTGNKFDVAPYTDA